MEKSKIKINSNLQIIKYFLAFLIILYHDSTAFGYKNNLFLEPIIGASLTIFILINGYVKINSENYNFLKLFLNIIICLILNSLILLFFSFINVSSVKVDYIFLGGRDWWYIWCYLFLQPFVKYLNLFVHKLQPFFVISCIIFMFIFSVLTINLYSFGQIFSIFNLFYFITFYLIGGIIRKYFPDPVGIKIKIISSSIFILIYFLIIFHNIYYYNSEWAISTNNLFSYILSISIFLLIICIPKHHNKFINYLGDLSLYVYLFHYIIQIVLFTNIFEKNLINFNPIFIRNIFYGLIVFLVTTFAVIPIKYLSEKYGSFFEKYIYYFWKKLNI